MGSYWKRKVKSESGVTQSCPTLCDPVDCSPPGSSVHGILQARILEWVPFSRGSSKPRDWTQVSCIAGRRFNLWATREAWINEKGPNFYNFLFPHLHCCRGHWHSSLSRKPECLACFPLDLGYGRNQAKPIFFFFFLVYFNPLAATHSVWDLSSTTRDWTHAPCIGSTKC